MNFLLFTYKSLNFLDFVEELQVVFVNSITHYTKLNQLV
jgi:hypothetical protein